MRPVTLLLLCLSATCCMAQRPTDPPEDGGRYTLVVVTQPRPTYEAQQLLSWLATDPNLQQLVRQVHYHQFDTSNPIYQQRYAGSLPQAPAIALVRPDGGVEYKASGPNIPRSAAELHDDMLHYHQLMPYYPPRQPEVWPDTRAYAVSQGFPLRDSAQISPRSFADNGGSVPPWVWLAAAVGVMFMMGLFVVGGLWLYTLDDA